MNIKQIKIIMFSGFISLFLTGVMAWAESNTEAGCALDFNYTTRQYDTAVSQTDIESTIMATSGDQLMIAVLAQNVKNLDTFQAIINFDPLLLQFIGAYNEISIDEKFNLLTINGGSAPFFMSSIEAPGTLNISNALAGNDTNEAPEGTGIIAFVKFKVLDDNINNILSLSNVFFMDSSGAKDAILNLSNATINPADENLPPQAFDDTIIAYESKPFKINILANDNDPDGDSLSIISFTQPSNGTIELADDHTFTYTSNESFIGTDAFAYTISDGKDTDSANVNITVEKNLLKLSLSDVQGFKVDQVSIPVSVNNPESDEIKGVYLIVEYDKNMLSPVDISLNNPLKNTYTIIDDKSVENELLIGIYTQTSPFFSGEGELAYLTFDIKGDCGENSVINVKTSEMNEIPVDSKGSTVHIVSAPTITSIGNQVIDEDHTTQALAFSISDCDDNNLTLHVESDNQSLIPDDDSHIQITGSDSYRSLTVSPLANASGIATITLTVMDSSGFQTSTAFDVTVNPVADIPELTLPVDDITKYPDSSIDLGLQAALTDQSELLSVLISGVPSGVMLSKGTDNGDGTWTLDESQLDGLKLLPDNGFIGDFQLQITAISKESGVDETATISKQVQISIKGLYIAGKILYQNQTDQPVADVLLSLLGEKSYSTTTDVNGNYTITGIVPGDYELIPSKMDDLGGLTITDAGDVAMIVARKETPTPLQKIAADVTMNGYIRPTDITNIALAATENNGFDCVNDQCAHWVFPVNAPENTEPISYVTSRKYKSLNANMDNQTFIGIRLGDIDGNWQSEK
jgi:hypothetical protein